MTVKVFDLDIDDLPDGYTPLEVLAVVKALDDTGAPRLLTRFTAGLSTWEVIGLLRLVEATEITNTVGSWITDDDNDIDPDIDL